jgi:hypothetical protein
MDSEMCKIVTQKGDESQFISSNSGSGPKKGWKELKNHSPNLQASFKKRQERKNALLERHSKIRGIHFEYPFQIG